MRGTVAKRLRRNIADALVNLSPEATYAPVQGTGRMKEYPHTLVLDENGKQVPLRMATCTFALGTDCRRHFTQRYKRAYVRFA
jgi:hypothetical protein